MRLPPLLGVTVLFAGMAGSAAADIIVWRDASGVSHYTNDVSNVPPEYQGEAMTVAKEWSRALPPADPPSAAASPEAGAAPPAREAYEAAYAAGLRAGGQADAARNVPSHAGTVAQQVEVQPPTAVVADRSIPVPVVVGGGLPPRVPHRTGGGDRRVQDRFPPATRAPFLQGPAGPPPISER
jgi:hypothetical protein